MSALVTSLSQLLPLLLVGGGGFILARASCPSCRAARFRAARSCPSPLVRVDASNVRPIPAAPVDLEGLLDPYFWGVPPGPSHPAYRALAARARQAGTGRPATDRTLLERLAAGDR